MYAIKGGWVGQTFALAKGNDSEGKKSRIRRSKEERKTMVESFIKKYQRSNSGNFPSLNLTHKEVGGSFYTVREIVREIIQENKVLGPAKLIPEALDIDGLLDQYPFGSISTESQTHFLSSNNAPTNTHIAPDEHQDTIQDHVLSSIEQCPGPELQRFDDEHIVNGHSQAVEKDFSSNDPVHTEFCVRESLEREQDMAIVLEASITKRTQIATDVAVETFPLKPLSKTIISFDGKSGQLTDLAGTVEDKETEDTELETGKSNSLSARMNFVEHSAGVEDEKAEANPAGPLLERNDVLMAEKAGVSLGGPSSERFDCSTTKESIAPDINDSTDFEVNDVLHTEIKPTSGTNGIDTENVNSTNSGTSHGQSTFEEAVAIKNKPDIQHGGISQKGSNVSLDRINLESWEGTSKKSAGSETNPLLAFFKAFVSALVKFWSE